MSVAELNNKIVFITGGGAGIGLKSVNAFADASCTVIANEVLRGTVVKMTLRQAD